MSNDLEPLEVLGVMYVLDTLSTPTKPPTRDQWILTGVLILIFGCMFACIIAGELLGG